jgi:nitrogen fixation-related uncharacterized protein
MERRKQNEKFAIQWLAHVSIIIFFLFVVGFLWGWESIQNEWEGNEDDEKQEFFFSSRTVSAHCDARLALSTGTAARMVS